MQQEKSHFRPMKPSDRIKQARWNVRLIPFGIALFVGVGLYCCFFPVRPIPWRDEMLACLLLCGALLWLQSLYFNEKYFLKTGQERLSYGHTIGLVLCAIAFVVGLIVDKKPQFTNGFYAIAICVYLVNRFAKHIAVFRQTHQNRLDR